MVDDLKYPFVECDKHPGVREPGYMVCIHTDRDRLVFDRANPSQLGVICCEECKQLLVEPHSEHEATGLFHLMCAACAREKRLLVSA